MFRCLLRHPQGELFITFQNLLEKVLRSDKRVLPDDGAVSAETCRRYLVNNTNIRGTALYWLTLQVVVRKLPLLAV
jgi:hypothetical protein